MPDPDFHFVRNKKRVISIISCFFVLCVVLPAFNEFYIFEPGGSFKFPQFFAFILDVYVAKKIIDMTLSKNANYECYKNIYLSIRIMLAYSIVTHIVCFLYYIYQSYGDAIFYHLFIFDVSFYLFAVMLILVYKIINQEIKSISEITCTDNSYEYYEIILNGNTKNMTTYIIIVLLIPVIITGIVLNNSYNSWHLSIIASIGSVFLIIGTMINSSKTLLIGCSINMIYVLYFYFSNAYIENEIRYIYVNTNLIMPFLFVVAVATIQSYILSIKIDNKKIIENAYEAKNDV